MKLRYGLKRERERRLAAAGAVLTVAILVVARFAR
jgi:hypothetical protein